MLIEKMNTQETAFFFEIQKIREDSKIFDELQNQELFFSYFQVGHKYYLFFYQQKFIDIDSIEPLIYIIQELDTKQRQIRSLRGFFLYILEIMDLNDGKDFQILTTNLQASFWRKLRKILRQNKRSVLLEFLFGKGEGEDQKPQDISSSLALEKLQNEVNSLQERIVELENQNLVIKEKLNMLSATDRSSKFDTSTLKVGNTTSNQNEVQNRANFITSEDNFVDDVWQTPADLSEDEKIEIIQLGFQLTNEKKISSLKKYYESTQEYSLFQLKGYKIKYESIRKFYKRLKPSTN